MTIKLTLPRKGQISVAIALGLLVASILHFQNDLVLSGAASPSEKNSSPRAVSCLGRLVPGDKLIHLTGPYTIQGPSLVKELMVKRGARLKKGEVVAKLHSFDLAQAQLRQAEAEVQVAHSTLQQVKAGEKESIIAAQQALALKFEAEMKNAESFLKRDRELLAQKTISAADFERSELAARVAQKNYEQATNSLQAVKEVRPVDLAVAEARLASARENAARLAVELENALIRTPIDGVVIDILAYPGEILDRNPLALIGDVDQMQVEAEVYVTDIPHVRLGSGAMITGDGFQGELAGTVSQIALQVGDSTIYPPNPATFSDKRIVKVWIKLAEPAKVSALANNQVAVVIKP